MIHRKKNKGHQTSKIFTRFTHSFDRWFVHQRQKELSCSLGSKCTIKWYLLGAKPSFNCRYKLTTDYMGFVVRLSKKSHQICSAILLPVRLSKQFLNFSQASEDARGALHQRSLQEKCRLLKKRNKNTCSKNMRLNHY